jgi:hypothetical protein
MTARSDSRPSWRDRLPRGGFTLFEVAISLALMAFGVVSILVLFPTGIKAQQMARFQIYASAKALEMVESYNAVHNSNPAIDFEAPNSWDVHVSYKSQAPDLESRLSSYRFGLMPLPTDIARRLDSDGDQIQRILAQGGYLYYSQPLASGGLSESGFASGGQPNEAQKLIIGVIGYPQNNMLYTLPQKAWPYYTPYPSPPVHMEASSGSLYAGSSGVLYGSQFTGSQNTYLWEDINLSDPDIRPVFTAYMAHQNFVPPSPPTPTMPATYLAYQPTAQTYANAAVAYCTAKGLPTSLYDGTTVLTDFVAGPVNQRYQQVIALRFVAHAASCLLQAGGTAAGALTITPASVQVLHDNCMFLATRFQAMYPYDWGAPRPLQHAIMMDFPLIEYDLAAPPLTGTIFGASGITAEQWKPVAPQQILNMGRSISYPDVSGVPAPTLDTIWGPTSHSTLTAPFNPSDRCRQIVFWAVDWQAYEDFETAPSAPVDASKYPKGAPYPGRDFTWAMNNPQFMDWHQFGYRNPEKVIVFTSPSVGQPTGSGMATQGVQNFTSPMDQGTGATQMDIFNGRYGADRNYNGKLDRGTVPQSVRMRAITVAKFNYYDLRVPAVIR